MDRKYRQLQQSVRITNVNNNKVTIQRISQLDGMYVTAIESYLKTDMTKDQNGLDNVAESVFRASFITLKDYTSREKFQTVPLVDLSRKENFGKEYKLQPLLVAWDNSFITIADSANLNVGDVFILQVTYFDPRDSEGLELLENPEQYQ